jgi:hypothetical protein
MLPDVAADAWITPILGVRPRWAWLLCIVVVLAAGGVGGARYLGYDVLHPLRGVSGSPSEDAQDALPLRSVLELQLLPQRGPAYAERELDAPAEPAPSSPAPRSKERYASTAAETPDPLPAPPSPEDPYGMPPGL